jgi:hypothetical protein
MVAAEFLFGIFFYEILMRVCLHPGLFNASGTMRTMFLQQFFCKNGDPTTEGGGAV